MEQGLNNLTERGIIEKIQQLESQQIAEVIDFIQFLAEKKQKEAPLVQFLNETSGPRYGIDEVRRRLAKIPGNMSDLVRELRDERG